ncbi:MAG TPA: sodium:solute symporter, partial [Melioribacteraceae bacterium]|nr:sodium:solute symporter [Melioribacteraceae bacterium]
LAQWMGTKYNSKVYSFFFGVLSLLLITFIVLIAVGITKVLANALNVSELNVLIVFVLFVFGYMMFGGANSMVYTNTIQALIMVVVAFILLTSGYDKLSNGIGGFFNELFKIDPNLTKTYNNNSFLFRDFYEIFISQAVIGIAIVCQPHIITKSLLLKEEKDVNRYLITGIIVQMLFFLVVITGLYARLTFPDLTINGKVIGLDSVIPTYVVTKFPVYVTLVLILGLISAGISTLEGLIQSVSTTITQDLIKPIAEYFGINNFKNILINRFVIIILAVVTIFLSYEQIINPKLSVGIFAQNGVYAYFSAAFVPIIFGMFFKNTKKEVVISGSVAAIVTHFVMYYGKIKIPFSIATGENPGVAASAAIIISITVSLIIFLSTKRGQNV